MNIYVDADACPVPIKETLCRAAIRTKTLTTFIANQPIRLPPSPYLKAKQVASGLDVADDEIVRCVQAGDLVISGDIPLAAEAIDKGATVLNARGELLTLDNVKARLTLRDFMETLRSSGIQTGGPAPLNQADKQRFANQLDKWLQQKKKR